MIQPSNQPHLPGELSDPHAEGTSSDLELSFIARTLFASALAECSIPQAVQRSLQVREASTGETTLLLGHSGAYTLRLGLGTIQRVRVVAAGKAAGPLLQATLAQLNLPSAVDLQGILIAPAPPSALPSGFQFFRGGHPLPNAASLDAAHAVLAMLQAIPVSASRSPDTLCLFLLSGGASAMMELPLDPAISLEDTVAFHRILVHSQASIAEINCVRKHFSAVKGGRLGLLSRRTASISLFVSDVPSDHIDALGSGPTVPDSTTVEQCLLILNRYQLLDRLPTAVRQFFLSRPVAETPKPGEINGYTFTLLDSNDLAQAALHHATQKGFHAVLDNTCDDWEARAAADYLLARLEELRRNHPRVCLVSVGELTVASPDNRLLSQGCGGRNQHFALYAATRLDPSGPTVAVLSAGSDGIDGNSSRAGAVVDQHSLQGLGLRAAAQQALQTFHSTPFLDSLGATLTTGPTGNNLRDLRILLSA
ncbi:MAG: glycerate kinase type-2 family protein [Acidobacteriaceae bacterium]